MDQPMSRVLVRLFILPIAVVAALLMLASTLSADPTGSAPPGRATKVVANNLSGDFIASLDAEHRAVPGARRFVVTIDVKDPAVARANLRASAFCDTASGSSTETRSRDDLNVSGNRKGRLVVRLPAGHDGCDIRFNTTITRTSGNDFRNNLVSVTRLVLTGRAG
jgi:hypothetical protein